MVDGVIVDGHGYMDESYLRGEPFRPRDRCLSVDSVEGCYSFSCCVGSGHTLTYGEPTLTELLTPPDFKSEEVLSLTMNLEHYSEHPLASAILKASVLKNLTPFEATEVHEAPGQGLLRTVNGRKIQVTNRKKFARQSPAEVKKIPPTHSGLECVVVVDGNPRTSFLSTMPLAKRQSLSFLILDHSTA